MFSHTIITASSSSEVRLLLWVDVSASASAAEPMLRIEERAGSVVSAAKLTNHEGTEIGIVFVH